MNQNKELKDNVIRESVNTERPVWVAGSQAVAEGELSAPSALPPIAKVLMIDGRVSASSESGQDRLDVSGAVALSVLYICESGKVHGFESVALFKHSIEMDNVRSGMRSDVNPSVDAITHTFENGSLRVRAIINLECSASERAETAIVRRIDGSDIEMMTVRFNAGYTQVDSAEHTLREDARLPRPASKLLCVNGYARVQNVALEGNLARVTGMLRLSILFAALDGMPVQTPVALPFEHTFPLADGASSASGVAQILQLSAALMDEDVITVDAHLLIKLFTFVERSFDAVADAYSTKQPIVVNMSPILSQRSVSADLRCMVRTSLPLPEGMPAVDRVMLVVARPSVATATALNGLVKLDGTLQVSAVYMTREGEPYGFTGELPFSCEGDAPMIMEGMSLSIHAACEANGSAAAGNEIPLQCMIDAIAIATNSSSVNVVTGITAGKPAAAELYGPVIYFPMVDETMWDVGKRFAVPQTELTRLNPEAAAGSPGKAVLLNIRRMAN